MSNVAKLKKRALDYEQKKQFDKALDAYMQVLGALGDHIEEGDVALFNRVGDLLLRQGNVGAAVDHYERAVDLYAEGGFHNNAIALCSKILRNAPGRTSIYYKLGRISAQKGFTSDAKTNFLEYADRMQRIGQVEEAFRALKEFADLCPDQDDIRLMLADQLVRADRKPEAVEQLQLLYDKLQLEGRAQEAKATLDRIRAIDPSHQPTTGVSRPTPKANDLIFIDVGFDTPGTSTRRVTGSIPVVPAADAIAPTAPPAESPALAESEQPLPLIDVGDIGSDDDLNITPLDGLATGAMFDAGGDGADVDAGGAELEEVVAQGPVDGFEETALGAAQSVVEEIAPLDGIEQSAPLAPSEGEDGSDAQADDARVDVAQAAEESASTSNDTFEEAGSGLLDISLDLIDDSLPESSDGLTFIFPDGDTGTDWRREDASAADEEPAAPALDGIDEASLSTELPELAEPAASPDDSLRFEPLLQLPELETPDESLEAIDGASDLPLISLEDEDEDGAGDGAATLVSSEVDGERADGDAVDEVEAEDSSTELLFLDTGADQELTFISAPDLSPAPASGSDEVVPELATHADAARADRQAPDAGEVTSPAEPAVADFAELSTSDLRAVVELNPDDWETRRRLGEALLEEGDRGGGLAELERAMQTIERVGDLRGATAIVNELIRVEPHSVVYHQKRVEYAVRSNDRSLLAESYYSLAENLFQMGEIGKSRAVYTRVLELSPGDARVRAALQAIDDEDDEKEDQAALPPSRASRPERKEAPAPPTREAELERRAPVAAAPVVPADAPPYTRTGEIPLLESVAEELPVAHGRDTDLDAAVLGGDFVNLADWLDEDAPTRNTRMVVDVKEPEIQEQVDFAEMLAMFKQGVAANVDEADHEAHYDLGVAYKEMGLLDEAISEFQKALRGTGNRARTYEALGQCFVERGQYQIAVTILSRAIGDKSYTDDMLVGVLYLLGYASESLGRWADAQRFYERVFAVDIEFRDIGDRLAVAERGGK